MREIQEKVQLLGRFAAVCGDLQPVIRWPKDLAGASAIAARKDLGALRAGVLGR
jgi:hypothetical protein